MQYSDAQIKFIQERLLLYRKKLTESQGLTSLAHLSDFKVWVSHANLAGYNVENATGKMYKQEGKVRTYV